MRHVPSSRSLREIAVNPVLLLLLAALAAAAPLLVHGMSCGQDLGFHVVSWLDAAQQLRHGHYPRWAVTPAWNAGEPRFIFYPPLSWLLGALLTQLFGAGSTPVVFVFLVLVAASFSMYTLARHFVSKEAAVLAGAVYIGNPYMLFNAVERSAMAELMAAVWIPLLLLGVLHARPTGRGIAVPLALLWLTNAPAAVMGSYTLALVAVLRIAHNRWVVLPEVRTCLRAQARFASTFLYGAALGLALPAFYLIPAACERRFVQVAMAIIPNMRFQDNFLFYLTSDAAHNAVNHTASVLALTLLAVAVAAIAVLYLRVLPSRGERSEKDYAATVPILATVIVVIAFLLVSVSGPVWAHLPEFAFLQFPWRLLSILSAVTALTLALLLGRFSLSASWKLLAPLLALAMSAAGYGIYRQHCEAADEPATIARLLATHHGVGPTDEYTPNDADNDGLRTGNPGYWLASTPNAPAPNTVPTAAELHAGGDDTPVPLEQTLSAPAPRHLQLDLPEPEILILNLRDYPAWFVTRTSPRGSSVDLPAHLQRDDGLIALALPAGVSVIDIGWHQAFDQWTGLAISVLAMAWLLAGPTVSRRIRLA